MNWKSYEETVKNIYAALGARNEVEIECYGNSCKYIGRSGVTHQLDVITSLNDGIHRYKTAIECKYWNETINKDIVMKIIEIRDDCGFSKGVVVSKIGFTPDAIKFAEYNNIGLVELREPAEEDLENRLKGINVNIYPTKPEILEFKNILHESESQEELSFEFNTNDAYYLFPDTSIKTIKNILHEFFAGIWHSQKFNVIIETETIFPDITHLKSSSNNLSIRVKLLLIKGILRTDFQETVAIKWEDKVWLIMKAVFERKMFTVSPAGKIQEIPYD